MRKKRAILGGVLTLALLGAAAIAQERPPEGVKASRHENLAAAQHLIEQAYQKITDAQKANHNELGGHAQKAKELLDQANRELGMAADEANENHK